MKTSHLLATGLPLLLLSSLAGAATLSEAGELEAVTVLGANPRLESTDFAWGEVVVRGQGFLTHGAHFVTGVGVSALGRLGQSPGRVGSDGMIRVDHLSVGAVGLAGGRVDVTLGRMDLKFGEGFLLADGVSDLAQFPGGQSWLDPWTDFDALHIRGETEGLLMEGFAAKRQDGTLLGGDAQWALPFAGPIWGDGGASFLALVRPGSPRQMASIRGAVGLSGVSVLGEFALQGGSDGELAQGGEDIAHFAGAGYLKGRWNVPHLPVPGLLEGGGYFYSGDGARSVRSEGWEPLFQRDPNSGQGMIGVLDPQLPGYQTDQLQLFVKSEAEVALRHTISMVGLTRLTHRGTAQCLEQVAAPQCVLAEGGAIGTAGSLTPMLLEVDLTYGYEGRGLLAGSFHNITAAYAKPLKGAQALAVDQEGNVGPLMGDTAAFALLFASRMAF